MVMRYEDAKRRVQDELVAELTGAIDETIITGLRRNDLVISHHLPSVSVDSPQNEIPTAVGEEITRLYSEAGWNIEIVYPQVCESGRVILTPK